MARNLGYLLSLLWALQGCTAAAVGGALGGAVVVQDRRTTGSVIEDQAIEVKARLALRREADVNRRVHANFTSFNRVLLVTGETPTEELRDRVHEIVRNIENVRRVHNELILAAPSAMLARSSDTYVTAKVKSKFAVHGELNPWRVKVVTENGTTFLLGIVAGAEAELATQIARNTSGVERVVRLFEDLPTSK